MHFLILLRSLVLPAIRSEPTSYPCWYCYCYYSCYWYCYCLAQYLGCSSLLLQLSLDHSPMLWDLSLVWTYCYRLYCCLSQQEYYYCYFYYHLLVVSCFSLYCRYRHYHFHHRLLLLLLYVCPSLSCCCYCYCSSQYHYLYRDSFGICVCFLRRRDGYLIPSVVGSEFEPILDK